MSTTELAGGTYPIQCSLTICTRETKLKSWVESILLWRSIVILKPLTKYYCIFWTEIICSIFCRKRAFRIINYLFVPFASKQFYFSLKRKDQATNKIDGREYYLLRPSNWFFQNSQQRRQKQTKRAKLWSESSTRNSSKKRKKLSLKTKAKDKLSALIILKEIL